jgi:hypothetical protein
MLGRLIARLSVTAVFSGVVACGSGTTGGYPYEGGAGDGGSELDGGAQGCKEAYPSSQALSQPCCLAWGPDACGAALFCAAFDGRTQATCYAQRSRLEGEECTLDIQCAGGSCDLAQGCKSSVVVPPPPPPPPPEKKCPSSCTSSAQCQSACPALPSGIQCCDKAAGACYASNTATCPGG